jgi:hypothetical protein
MIHSRALIFSIALSLAAIFPVHSAQDTLLKRATFCRGLDEKQSPKDPTESFAANETIYLSLELKGRPKTGIVSTKFKFRNDTIAEGKVDVAKVNEGVIFSVGENTFAGFNLSHKNPLPIGDCYSAEVSFDGKSLGTFPFKIAPPKGAVPTKLLSVTLARDVDDKRKPVGETREFSAQEKVMLVGTADLGLSSWMEAIWAVGGKIDDAATRTLDIEENKKDVPFSFSFLPAGGWPAGTHEAVLHLDGKEAAREKFTVKAGKPMVGVDSKIEIASSHLFQDDGKGAGGKEVKAFTTDDTVFHAHWKLKTPASAKGIQFVWKLVEAAGAEAQTIATADLNAGVNDRLISTLTIKKGLPAGKYRVELIKDGEQLDAKAFEVK